jgi:hypothetical protein
MKFYARQLALIWWDLLILCSFNDIQLSLLRFTSSSRKLTLFYHINRSLIEAQNIFEIKFHHFIFWNQNTVSEVNIKRLFRINFMKYITLSLKQKKKWYRHLPEVLSTQNTHPECDEWIINLWCKIIFFFSVSPIFQSKNCVFK